MSSRYLFSSWYWSVESVGAFRDLNSSISMGISEPLRLDSIWAWTVLERPEIVSESATPLGGVSVLATRGPNL